MFSKSHVTFALLHYASITCAFLAIVSLPHQSLADEEKETVQPLHNAHAHNDYWHDKPLLDAMSSGFMSVECDIFLSKNELLVGHEPSELTREKTFEKLYLQPLSQIVNSNGGMVYKNRRPFILLVDLKSERQATYEALRTVLEKYKSMLTTWDDNCVQHGAVTIVLTSAKPYAKLISKGMRYTSRDGRLTDQYSSIRSCKMPLISDRWGAHFSWNGKGPFPDAEREKLKSIAINCHSHGRLLRMWGTPENEALWQELLNAGVDLINTDDLSRLKIFLLNASLNNPSANIE